ncbi:MAG: tetratricopeptide repeat protein, partial [Bryobacteraceae bacterium]|nr:tetratricopeptide repeat protein [Bryobacteraceae bacterium]
TNSWGYGYHYGYVNPYYTTPVVATVSAYDYSQPIVINSYEESGDQNAATEARPPAVTESSAEQAGYRLFDQAREAFKRSDYRTALKFAEQALQKVPNDPVLHEFNALCLFANGQYQASAAVLNALLAVAPGMDWTTLTSVYGNVDEYTGQLRALETHCKQTPADSAAAFVLAYHYLICGHADSAKDLLQRVVETQTNDQVARRMYEALKGQDEIAATPPSTAAQAVAEPDVQPTPQNVKPDEPTPTTDLIGKWHAERDGNAFDLTIDEQGQFAWKATLKDREPTTITGNYSTTEDTLVMDSADQGTMAGRVTSGGPDKFQFAVAGGPPGDTGLEFQRVNAQP